MKNIGKEIKTPPVAGETACINLQLVSPATGGYILKNNI